MRVGPTRPAIPLDTAVVGATGRAPASPDPFPIAAATLLPAMTLPLLGCQQTRLHTAQGVPSSHQVRPLAPKPAGPKVPRSPGASAFACAHPADAADQPSPAAGPLPGATCGPVRDGGRGCGHPAGGWHGGCASTRRAGPWLHGRSGFRAGADDLPGQGRMALGRRVARLDTGGDAAAAMAVGCTRRS